MSFFGNVNEKFFNPFCCRNRELYFACIDQLIEKSKEVPVLCEKDARNTLILYLRNCECSIETENIGEVISNKRTPQENASAILRYFRSCGWIAQQEISRSGDNIAAVTVLCRKVIEALHKIFDPDRDADAAISNNIFRMHEVLTAVFSENSARLTRPYLNILVPLIENEEDLKSELISLKDSIKEIMREIMKKEDVNSLGQFMIRDRLLIQFFEDYFFIKNSGVIPSYISTIERNLRKLRYSEELFQKIVEDCARVKNLDEVNAAEKVNHQFDELESFISYEYEKNIDYIDKQINKYYNLYTTRMTMVMNGGTNLANELSRFLLLLKGMNENDREAALRKVMEANRIMSIGYIGVKSFERRRKKNKNEKAAGLNRIKLSEEKRKELTEELMKKAPDKYSMENTTKYFENLMGCQRKISAEAANIRSREDAMMFAASVLYADSKDFPFKVEFDNEMVDTDPAWVKKIMITKKGKENE